MKKLASRTAQYPMVAEFVFSHNEWVVDASDGAKRTFGSTVALSTDPAETSLNGAAAATVVFDAIPMPIGAVVVGGEIIVETAFVGPTAATLSVGKAGATTGLASAVDILAAAGTRTALSLTTPLAEVSGANVRLTMAYTVANATAGKVRVRVMYTIDGKTSEVAVN